MTTALFTHASGLAHVTPPGHPERVERLAAIHAALDHDAFAALNRRDAPLADRAEVLRGDEAILCHLLHGARVGERVAAPLEPGLPHGLEEPLLVRERLVVRLVEW